MTKQSLLSIKGRGSRSRRRGGGGRGRRGGRGRGRRGERRGRR